MIPSSTKTHAQSSPKDRELFRGVGLRSAIAVATEDKATQRFLEEWRSYSLRVARPAAVSELMQSYFEGFASAKNHSTAPAGADPAADSAWQFQKYPAIGQIVRFQENMEVALANMKRSLTAGEGGVDLVELGLPVETTQILEVWGDHRGVPLQSQPGAAGAPKLWPAALVIRAIRVHVRTFTSSDLPPHFITWALQMSLAHGAEPSICTLDDLP